MLDFRLVTAPSARSSDVWMSRSHTSRTVTVTATASTMNDPMGLSKLVSQPETPRPSAPLQAERSASSWASNQPKKQARNRAPASESPVSIGRNTGVFWRSST